MSRSTAVDGPIAVIKVGGSILTSAKAYRRAAKFVRHPLRTGPRCSGSAVVYGRDSFGRAAYFAFAEAGRCSCPPEYPRSRPHGTRNRKRSWANSIARGTAARRAGKICGCGGAGIFGGEFRERNRIAGARRLGSNGGAAGRGLASLSLRID